MLEPSKNKGEQWQATSFQDCSHGVVLCRICTAEGYHQRYGANLGQSIDLMGT